MLAIAIAVSACTSRGPDGALESWNNYSNKPISTEGLKENQALAVFYRPVESQKKAINVYVNGDYQCCEPKKLRKKAIKTAKIKS